jgi:hypothetical protein
MGWSGDGVKRSSFERWVCWVACVIVCGVMRINFVSSEGLRRGHGNVPFLGIQPCRICDSMLVSCIDMLSFYWASCRSNIFLLAICGGM